MITINDWQTIIYAIRRLARHGNTHKNEKNFQLLIKFLKEKGIRTNELNTNYNPKEEKKKWNIN